MAKLITKKQASKCATIVSKYSVQQAKIGAKKVSSVTKKSFAKLKSLFKKK